MADAVLLQDRFGQRARAGAEVHDQRRGDIRHLFGGTIERRFVTRDVGSNRFVVGVDLKTQVAAYGMAHRLIVAKSGRGAQSRASSNDRRA